MRKKKEKKRKKKMKVSRKRMRNSSSSRRRFLCCKRPLNQVLLNISSIPPQTVLLLSHTLEPSSKTRKRERMCRNNSLARRRSRVHMRQQM